MSAQVPERRRGADRRHFPRGGRRPEDPKGYAPLVLVADDDASNGARCVAILSRLRFAVAPVQTVDEAMKVLRTLQPNLIVARMNDEQQLRDRMAADPAIAEVPIVTITAETDEPEALVREIRRALSNAARTGGQPA